MGDCMTRAWSLGYSTWSFTCGGAL